MPDTSHPTDVAPLRAYLLGGFRVSVGTRSIEAGSWRLRKAGALVKILALTSTHRLHREQVFDLLWPDHDLKAASNNLHHALHVARHTLSDGQASASPYLRFEGELLLLGPSDALWIDVEAFESAIAEARRLTDPAVYRSALALYAGDLLPEDLYEEWAVERREALRALFLSGLLELAGLYGDDGQLGQAIGTLQRATTSEPTLEEAHTRLMRLYARTGQRHQALRQYERIRRALQEELDTEPDEATTRLYQEILAGQVPSQGTPTDHRSAEHRNHNLPVALNSFIGREDELDKVKRLLGTARLVTVTGAGGAGKTRLALQAAGEMVGEYRDGIWLVEFASLRDPMLVPQAVAGVLEVQEQDKESLSSTLVEILKTKSLLLVLDNCEHLVAACAQLAETLLRACPGLRILATSREPLNIDGELTDVVPPLSLPAPGRLLSVVELLGCDSVRLFVDRAQQRQPAFLLTPANAPAIVRICRQVDGIPLAIELAAARVALLSVEQIAQRLDDVLGLLTGGKRTSKPEHQTLRRALDWSYELLSEPERTLFNRLSVFVGGWTLEAAEGIGTDLALASQDVLELLSRLVDKSLVVADMEKDSRVRYRLLEPIRQYAQERLAECGDADTIQRRHATIFMILAEETRPKLQGPDQLLWLDRLETEHDNFRAALAWCVSHGEDREIGLRMAHKLCWFWYVRGYAQEGRKHLAELLAGSDDAPAAALAGGFNCAGSLAYAVRNYAEATAFWERTLELQRELNDPHALAMCLGNLALVAHGQDDYQKATTLQEESLALRRQLDDRPGISACLRSLAATAHAQADFMRAELLYKEGLALDRELGDMGSVAVALNNLGELALDRGDPEAAIAFFHEGLPIGRGMGLRELIASCLDGLANAAFATDQAARAARLLAASNALRQLIGVPVYPREAAKYWQLLAAVRTALGDSFAAIWNEGESMTAESAVEYALSVDGESRDAALVTEEVPVTLTRREREIAELITQGLTNRQIAAELDIAERTVDSHVGNILGKLGLTSRVQVAASIDRAGQTPVRRAGR